METGVPSPVSFTVGFSWSHITWPRADSSPMWNSLSQLPLCPLLSNTVWLCFLTWSVSLDCRLQWSWSGINTPVVYCGHTSFHVMKQFILDSATTAFSSTCLIFLFFYIHLFIAYTWLIGPERFSRMYFCILCKNDLVIWLKHWNTKLHCINYIKGWEFYHLKKWNQWQMLIVLSFYEWLYEILGTPLFCVLLKLSLGLIEESYDVTINCCHILKLINVIAVNSNLKNYP